jgi:hypothetical protein
LLGILVQVNGSNDEKETEIETDIYICWDTTTNDEEQIYRFLFTDAKVVTLAKVVIIQGVRRGDGGYSRTTKNKVEYIVIILQYLVWHIWTYVTDNRRAIGGEVWTVRYILSRSCQLSQSSPIEAKTSSQEFKKCLDSKVLRLEGRGHRL